jgi:serine phosphatase RsbU (regulator of sigma subunit)
MNVEIESGTTPYAAIAEIETLQRDIENLKRENQELSTTNQGLVAATWRERDMKKQLNTALEELKAKRLVDEQNKVLTDSINYASKIQEAIIPIHEDLDGKFKDFFIFHQAKNVVSGDFPWIFEVDNFMYVAAVDCTGHGVPGAMMSVIGHLLLNDLVKRHEIDPATLLSHLHWSVVKTLKQAEEFEQTADGMDIALCRVDKSNNEIMFSGAHRPLYHLSNGIVHVFNGDKFPIGGNHYKGKNKFTNHVIKACEGDAIYFFSDGLPDQFGGLDGQKFGAKRIRELIVQNSELSMTEQHLKLRQAFDDWRGKNKQLDDLLMIGIKF